MKTNFKPLFVLLISSQLVMSISLHAEDCNKGKLKKTAATSQSYTKLNLNNVSTFIYGDGQMDVASSGNKGLIYPKWSGKGASYQSGLLWGAKVKDSILAGGCYYLSGLQPGKIISPGVAEDPKLAKNRIYRVRPDYKTASLAAEVMDEKKSESEIRKQYEKDWKEWPATDGAPFVEVDNDGKYNPDKDIPGVKDALQTIWYVVNDLDAVKTKELFGSVPMGIEMQATYWTYNKDWYLDNTYFEKFKIINKSGNAFKDMYTFMWSDTEIGSPVDDYSGCDSTLGLGYCYNADATDSEYGSKPPAVGYHYVQGPVANGTLQDTAIYNGRKIAGKKNLPMNAFTYYTCGGTCTEPHTGDYYMGTLWLYYNFQGKLGWSGEYYPVPASLGGGFTKFPLSGDPVTGTGYLDGVLNNKGDRYVGIPSGPFNMAPGDTQEVAISVILAQSSSNTASVGLLKNMCREIQKTYNNMFNFPPVSVPDAPAISAGSDRNEITLSWNHNSQIQAYDNNGYKFQGYNIYQLPYGESSRRGAVKLATFDIADGIRLIAGETVDTLTGKKITVIQQHGTDSEIKRTLSVKRDSIFHSSFLIGRKYYFGISTYTYRDDPEGRFTNMESPIEVTPVIFQEGLPGPKFMDTVAVSRSAGSSSGKVIPLVIDAAKLTGHDYQIGFDKAADSLMWYLKDVTRNQIVAKNQAIKAYNDTLTPGPVIDGVQITVIGAQPGMKEWKVPNGSLVWSSNNANSLSYYVRGFNGAIGDGVIDWPSFTYVTTAISPYRLASTIIKFAKTDTSGNILDPNDPNASYAYRYVRLPQNQPAKPEFAPFIKNKTQDYAYQDYTRSLPFAAYNYETGQRYMVGYMENNVANGTVDGKYWPPMAYQISNSSTVGPREWFFVFDLPYSTTPDPVLQRGLYSQGMPIMWFGMPTRNNLRAFNSGDEFLIVKNDLFNTGEVISFKTDSLKSIDIHELNSDYELAQNYPNPFNAGTTISFSLRERGYTTIKVYNLLGQLVRELVNEELFAGPHTVSFDASSLASGMYVYRLEVKDKYFESRKMIVLK